MGRGMPFELLIGLRYLRAKGGRGFLSLLTVIAMAGMAIGVMALIVVLAVMTGFEDELRSNRTISVGTRKTIKLGARTRTMKVSGPDDNAIPTNVPSQEEIRRLTGA